MGAAGSSFSTRVGKAWSVGRCGLAKVCLIILCHDSPQVELCSSYGSDALVDPNPVSEKSLGRMRGWIHQCGLEHDRCKKPEPRFMPTRLLDVGCTPSQSVRLVLAADPEDRYIALSHCWGSSTPLVTTSENISSFQAEILPSSFPNSFSDAIKITQLLGIRYLWIDSLCIVQDDPEDWLRESAMMASVYGNADITIVASKASSSAEGFLSSRHETFVLKKETNASGQETDLFLINREYNTNLISRALRSHQEPLSKRAWAIQERHLSRRRVVFAEAQIFWECNQMTKSEDTQLAVTHSSYGQYEPLSSSSWYDIVESFTNCEITYETDTFPAISGVAKTVARTTGGIYCAGLWMNQLCNSLLWYPQQVRSDGWRKIKRKRYVAPSFSWAASQGRVWYQDFSKTAISRSLCEYISHGQTLRTGSSDPYGGIEDAWIKLTAPLVDVDHFMLWDGCYIEVVWWLGNGEKYVIPAVFDHEEAKIPTHAFLLPLYYDKSSMQALLLIRAPDRENCMTFSRIGVSCTPWRRLQTVNRDGRRADSDHTFSEREEEVERLMSQVKGQSQTVVLV
jgi:hypothetical protein